MPTRARPKPSDTSATARTTPTSGAKRAKSRPNKAAPTKTETRARKAAPAKSDTRARKAASAGRPSAASPSPDEVRRRAFERYLARGGAAGQEVEDWLQAEADLVKRHTR